MTDNDFNDSTKCYVCNAKVDLLINLETDKNPKTGLNSNVQRYKLCTDCMESKQ